jgi:hypothetical protein
MTCRNVPCHDSGPAGDVSQAKTVVDQKLVPLIPQAATGSEARLFAGLSR